MKDKKGVTLIALVITIIVILILASIAIYSGASTIRYAKYNKAKSEIQVIQSYVNQWYKEYQNTGNVGNYGELIGTAIDNGKCTQAEIDSTFAGGGITDDNKKSNYRFFSESFLKDKIGIDASFEYLISIPDRNTILYNGIMYNKKPYYTLDDFGVQNIKIISPSSIEFELEQGENTDIVISNLQLGYGNNKHADISKFIVEYSKSGENIWNDITKDVKKFEDGEENNKTTKYKFSVDSFGEYEVRVRTTDKKLGDVKDITLEPRPGIKVGDYITYTSPTASVTLSTTETGYSSTQTLPRKNTFRVMDIDELGNMTLMGAMTSDDQPISFQGALGYNNAVYTLNEKCSELYKDTSKGITARSIKVEDITSKFNDTGNGKLTTYITNQMSSLSPSTNVTKDTTNNTVTYSNGNTYYPDIFQYEAGGLLGTTATTGVIGQSDSYSGYGGLTTNGAAVTSSTKPTNLTVPYTYYHKTHVAGDFEDSAKAAAYQNMFFGTGTYYWLASRCVYCDSSFAGFGLRIVLGGSFNTDTLYASYGYTSSSYRRVCPVVYLPSSVQVEISPSTDTSTYHKTVPHVVK